MESVTIKNMLNDSARKEKKNRFFFRRLKWMLYFTKTKLRAKTVRSGIYSELLNMYVFFLNGTANYVTRVMLFGTNLLDL